MPVIIGFVIFFGYVLFMYNQLVGRRNQVGFAFGTVDALLKKRHDLIPSLVAVAEAHAKHERGLFERIAELRARVDDTKQLEHRSDVHRLNAEIDLGQRLDSLLAIVESYPQLTADASFREVQHALVDNEAQIAAARRFYNAAVNDLNNGIDMFPTSVLASFMNLSPKPYFQASYRDRQAPHVKQYGRP